MTGLMAFARGSRRSLIGVALLLWFDVAFSGSALMSTLCCPVWILVSLVKNAIQRPGWGLALVRVGIPALTWWLVGINNDFQLAMARRNAQQVVQACELFHADQGRFPGNLEELVPRYMESVPRAKYCLIGRFQYFNSGNPMLVWQVVGFYRRIYFFEERRWSYLD